MADETAFCPSCGAPQIRVARREAAEAERTDTLPPPPPLTHAAPASPILLRVGQGPEQIHWKTFLPIAVPLAAAIGVSPVFHPALVWMLLPVSVLLAIHLYRRREPGLLRPQEGARLGAFSGLVSFGFYSAVIAFTVVTHLAEYRQATAQAIQEFLTRNPTPQAQQMAQWLLNGTRGVVLTLAMGLVVVLLFFLLIGSVSGALAARFSRKKSP